MIEEMALAMGVNLLVASNSRSASHERELVEGLIGRRVAGLIIAPGQADYSFLTTMPTPVVFMDRHPLGSASGVVRVDDRGGAKAAVAHLIAHGHRRIALVTDDPNIKTSALRRQGYHDALTDAGIVVDPNLEAIGCEVSDQAFTATERLLGVANPPTAIFSARSETSLGVIRALHNEQREDIAFISFGDFEMADVLRPAITVIDHDPRQLAEAAMIRLRQAMEHKQVDHTDTIVPLRLITRGSGELRPGREVMSA
jgi:LacI family transcriptional regulator